MLADVGIDLVSLLQQGGYAGVLVLAVVAFSREWIVPGTRYRRDLLSCEERCGEWKSLAKANVAIAERGIGTAEKLTEPDAHLSMVGDQELLDAARGRGLMR